MKSAFMNVMKKRRTIYGIGRDVDVTDGQLRDMMGQALKYTPTAHNTQLTRIVLLLHEHHSVFWDLVMDAILEQNPGKDMHESRHKIDRFRDGYATALFYNDTKETEKAIEEMPLYREEFEKWAHHANAMLQFSVWNLLTEAGLGASLQHYNPIVDERVRERWHIDPAWELVAQMPFGNPTEAGWDRTFIPIEQRLFVEE